MKSSKTSFLRNCISGWNVRCDSLAKKYFPFRNLLYLCSHNQSEGLVAMDA